MKIVYFNYLWDVQDSSVGASVHVDEFAAEFGELEHEIKVFYQNRKTGGRATFISEKRDLLKKKFSRILNQPHSFIANFKYLVREYLIINREKPDAVITRYDLLNFSSVLLARLKKIPVILEVNSPEAYESKRFYRHSYHWPLLPEFVERLTLRLADVIVVVSNELKDYFINEGIPERKMVVVPNGVNASRFSPGIPHGKLLSKCNIERKIVVGFAGSFHLWHGVDNLKCLIERSLTRFDNTCFLLVGAGVVRNELEEFAIKSQSENRVIFTGFIPHQRVPQYISAMDIALLPYPKLDFFYFSPLKLFEYMAAGKAILASRIGQIKEVVEDGYNGLLYEPGNANELMEKFERLVLDEQLRFSLGKRARETIIEKYTWQKNAEKIAQICQNLVKFKNKRDQDF